MYIDYKMNTYKKHQTDEEKKLFGDMKQFMVQAVCGIFMAYITTPELSQIPPDQLNQLFRLFLKEYLNKCWHSYGKKDDTYVIRTFDKILSHNLIKGSVCLIHWIDNIAYTMIKGFEYSTRISDLNKLSVDQKRLYFEQILAIIYDILTRKLSGFTCVGTCDDVYDGKDIFVASFTEK
jgi:uncharacterized protein (UPF0248 family)